MAQPELRPWPPTGLTTARWIVEVPVEEVDVNEIIFTQPDISLLHVLRAMQGHSNYTDDAYPHVIIWRGTKYLEDGHHRVAMRMLRGETTILARVLRLED